MIRQTSLDALEQLEKSGRGQAQRTRLLRYIINGKTNYTRAELSKYTDIPINAVCGRVNELIRSKAIAEIGRRKCKITGNMVLVVTAQEK